MTHFVWLKGVIYTRDIMNAREIKKKFGNYALRLYLLYIVGHGGSLVDLAPLVQMVASSNPTLAATYGPWASPSTACLWHFSVKLRHSIRAVSGAPLSSGGLEEAP